jgi:hypothetical protein
MCIKKNNPGCDPCEPCELQDCETGKLTNTEVTISGFPATRQLTLRGGSISGERRVTWSGFDQINDVYNLTPDENCNYFILEVDFDVTVTWSINRFPDDPCDCLDYDELITCTIPFRLTVSEGGISVTRRSLGTTTPCESGTIAPSSGQLADMEWNTIIARNSNWCTEHEESLTISGGICFTDCGDTAVGVNVEWVPTITP